MAIVGASKACVSEHDLCVHRGAGRVVRQVDGWMCVRWVSTVG